MPRALTQIEIKEKENHILNQAFKLYKVHSFKSFKMDDLAKECMMSKGILFKYFKTKEMLFLSMLLHEYEKRYNYFDEQLRSHNEMTLDDFKSYIMEQFEDLLNSDSVYLKLLTIKRTILEENQTYDFALKTNTYLHDLMLEYAQNILLKVNGLSLDKISNLLMFKSYLVSGYLNSYNKPGITKDVIEDGGLNLFEVDYKQMAVKAFKCFLESEL